MSTGLNEITTAVCDSAAAAAGPGPGGGDVVGDVVDGDVGGGGGHTGVVDVQAIAAALACIPERYVYMCVYVCICVV